MSIYDIISELASTTKRTEKESILQRNKENDLLKAVFLAALDPYRSYNIRKIPEYSSHNGTDSVSIQDFLNELPLFENRTYTGNAAIEKLAELLSSMSSHDAIIAGRILQKDLRCGVSTATVNKIWKGLIPTYPCLLGVAYKKGESEKNITLPAIAQIKADGMRANAFVGKDGIVKIRGRSGKEIDLLGSLDPHIKEFYSHCGFDEPIVLDGELVIVRDGNVLPRKVGNGILNKAIKGTISEKESDLAVFRIWDIIPLKNFVEGKYSSPYTERLSVLKVAESLHNNQKVEVIETLMLDSFDKIEEYYSESLLRGEEGIMLKQSDHYWTGKREKYIIKFKSEKECELKVIDWKEGTGKNAGLLGALICTDSTGKLNVSVGSGYSDAMRREFTKEYSIGKIITVKFNETIVDGNGNESLFLPRFLEVREDKDEADSLSKIKAL